MTDFFDLPHTFVVFTAGSGGNFLAGLLSKLISNDLTALSVNSTGSSHTVLNNKRLNGDSLCFGTLSDEQLDFPSSEAREQYYVDRIRAEYADITKPIVTWTHDYTNIPLYKKYFKNSRVLTIIHDTDHSRLSSLFMHVTKVLLDPSVDIPIRSNYWNKLIAEWGVGCRRSLSILLQSEKQAASIFNNRDKDQTAKEIMRYIGLTVQCRYYGMYNLAEGKKSTETCVYDFALYRSESNHILYSIGPNSYDYIDHSDSILPYSYLINDKPELLLNALSKTINRQLTQIETTFILDEYTRYHNAQNKDILVDPVGYYRTIKEQAMLHIKKLS